MQDHHTPDPAFKFKPDYKWPEKGNERNCPTDLTFPPVCFVALHPFLTRSSSFPTNEAAYFPTILSS